MSTETTPTARYTLRITSSTGYKSTTEGTCTPHQYSMAIAALNGAPHTSQELLAERDRLQAERDRCADLRIEDMDRRDELLEALRKIAGFELADEAAIVSVARAAIAKYEGRAQGIDADVGGEAS